MKIRLSALLFLLLLSVSFVPATFAQNALTLVKISDVEIFSVAGDVISYSYQVTASGGPTAGPITVTDDKVTVICPDVDTVGNNDASLDPGESLTCTASYVVVADDITSGFITNTAAASGNAGGTISNEDTVTVNYLPPGTPLLMLVKTTDPASFSLIGDVINYSHLVSSIGNAPVIGPITVADSRMTVTCPPVDTVGNNDDNLDVGESLVCTSSTVVTLADISTGYILTVSTASGANVSSGPVEISVPFVAPSAGFHVTKTFTDGSTDSVDVTLTCNSGLPLQQSFTIEGGDPAGVTFVVTNLPQTGATCTVTESGGPDGYTPVLIGTGGADCEWTDVTVGLYTCEIVNTANPGEFTVIKEWIISEDGGGDEVIRAADVEIVCDQPIIDGAIGGDGEFPTAIQLYSFGGTIPGNGYLTAFIDTSNGPANCTAFELDPDFVESGVEVSNDCPPFAEDGFISDPSTWLEVTAGGSAECKITNTVFFEGIPSLNQYGLALMALLMLGLGMVGFRRFA